MPTMLETKHDHITNPLDLLRGLIRRYVLIDGLLTAGLFAILWFWIGLAFDYGVFRITNFDWVLDAPKFLRIVTFAALALLLLGILVTRLWLRLHRELSYPSLALVLEKRFPKILGDRLITAVELADVAKAKAQGYSEEMLRATIAEARERVQQVPVASVFNWTRLQVKGGLLVLFAAGILAAVFAGFCIVKESFAPGAFVHSFGDVSLIWAERNLMLRNTPWPRQAHLEMLEFPGTEIRVGRDDAKPPKIKTQAFRWVTVDRGALHGWRPLFWTDIPSLTGLAPPDLGKVPGLDGQPLPAEAAKWDVDHLENVAGQAEAMKPVMAKLEELAAQPSMSRTLRKLAIPENVVLSYYGPKTSGKVSLTREANNLFVGEVSGLKESVRFTVKGADFITTPRSITLVPPPMFTRLTRTEYQPAYLYYPPPVTQAGAAPDFALLKGLRQVLGEKDLSLTGDKSIFSIVQGTEFELAGTSDKKLAKVQLKPKIGPLPGQEKASDIVTIEPSGTERESFRVPFRGKDRPVSNIEFDIVLIDDDGVATTRSMLVQVIEDQAPSVDLAVDVLRKQGGFYLVTPVAMVPFLGESKVRDDFALGKVEFAYSVSQVETGVVLAVQAQTLAGVFANVPLVPSIANAYLPAASAVITQSMTNAEKREAGAVTVPRFAEQFAGLRRETLENLQRKLGQPVDAEGAQIIREVKFQNQATDVFDLKAALPRLSAGVESGDFNQRFRVDLTLLATDANVESGPKTATSLEPIRLLVISEADLLGEISRDEVTQATRIDEVLKKLRETQGKLVQTADRLVPLSPPPDIIVASAVRAQDIAQDLAKCREITVGVLGEFRRLYREKEFNRIRAENLSHDMTVILRPLEAIIEKNFADVEAAHQQFQLALGESRRPDDSVAAADRFALVQLIAALEKLMVDLGVDNDITKLRASLTAVHNRQLAIGLVLKRIQRALIDRLLQPELAALPAIEMNQGETRTIKHGLNWRAYAGSLTVSFTGPGEAILKVPATVKVSDDREDFDYTLTAGKTPGEYKITLTPSAGTPITVTVKVK